MEREKLLDVEGIACLLGVKPSWVYTQVAKDAIPCVRVGRYLRFSADRVLRHFEAERLAERRARPE